MKDLEYPKEKQCWVLPDGRTFATEYLAIKAQASDLRTETLKQADELCRVLDTAGSTLEYDDLEDIRQVWRTLRKLTDLIEVNLEWQEKASPF